MKIVVLDGHTMNPGDLSWDALKALGDVTIHERTPAEKTVERAQGAEVVLTNKVALREGEIEQLNALQYIGVLATGYNVVDVQAARARDVIVCNVPAYSTHSVAQTVFAHLLHHTQHVAEHAQTVRDGRWTACPDFCYRDFPLFELRGMTMGIVGFGRIGQATGALAQAFGMNLIVHTTTPKPEAFPNVEFVDTDAVFKRADVVSLHCPLTPDTEGLVNADRLAMMKSSAFLINTSRGQVVDEPALAEALNNGRIAGAGLDVLSSEPPAADNPLLTAANCAITPHIAWATRAARMRLMDTVVENIKAFQAGDPQNVVGPQ